ncbi:hypothetical protein [Flavobacterium hydrophilum]|uniref:Uncharacterized protein n=1 Tax=Flavobacterium hydrophilum TaxID=2211445 RepID=A0A2V4BZ36_9FLAO|nr:hypothetical protein [Flavobacterium hydrophilum]PXY44288.1 hypothetical protein DMB68_17865 [Flavobacterium hydrophilum]
MRRIIVFLVFMNFLLLGGGQYSSAGTHQNSSAQRYEHKHRIKYITHEQGTSIIEEADLDLDEEYSGDAVKNGVINKVFTPNYSLLDNWYLTFSDQITVNYHSHFKFFVPFCGYSNPIYITQRVLRI